MRNTTYKYNIGDTVALKPEHYITLDIDSDGVEVKVTTVDIEDRRDYNGPTYKFKGIPGYYIEDCIKGKCLELPTITPDLVEAAAW